MTSDLVWRWENEILGGGEVGGEMLEAKSWSTIYFFFIRRQCHTNAILWPGTWWNSFWLTHNAMPTLFAFWRDIIIILIVWHLKKILQETGVSSESIILGRKIVFSNFIKFLHFQRIETEPLRPSTYTRYTIYEYEEIFTNSSATF